MAGGHTQPHHTHLRGAHKGDDTFEDGLGIIHYCRLGDLLRVVCDEGGRARSRATVPSTIVCAVPLGSVS